MISAVFFIFFFQNFINGSPPILINDDGVAIGENGLEIVGTVVGNHREHPNRLFSALPLIDIRNLNATEEVAMAKCIGG